MANINSVTIIGNITKDMELKYTSSGMAIGTFTIAVTREGKKDGQWVKESAFFDVSAFGKMPENLKPYMTKGKQVGIEGFLKQDRWVDQNTMQNRSKITIVANHIQLLGGGSKEVQEAADTTDTGYGYGN